MGNERGERENEKWEENLNWTLALLVTSFPILCFVSIFHFPILRDRSPFTAARFSNSPLGFSICLLNSD